MDEKDLRVRLGNDLFDKGKAIADAGAIERLGSIEDVEVFRVDDGSIGIVAHRSYESRDDLYDCSCSAMMCPHRAALEVMLELSDGTEEDDPDLIADLEDEIGSFVQDVLDDPDYDEENNYLEDWERRKYRVEDHNDEVEHDMALDLCSRIISEVRSPHEAIRLLDLLHRKIEDSDIHNDGFDEAYRELSDEIGALFHFADGDDVANVISHGWRCWAEPYLADVPDEVMDEGYRIARDSGEADGFLRDMMFERGDYEDYVASSRGSSDAVLKAAEALVGKGETDRAREICADMDPSKLSVYSGSERRFASLFEELGMKDEARVMYEGMYRARPCDEYRQGVERNSSPESADALVEETVRKVGGQDHLDFESLTYLASEGRQEAATAVRRIGFSYRNGDPWSRHLPIPGAVELVRALAAGGWHEEAALVARGLIDLRMVRKDADEYGDAVEMMRIMDSDPGFERLDEPHSAYKVRLRDEYPKMRKFWGMYDGTWKEKEKGRRGWYRWYGGDEMAKKRDSSGNRKGAASPSMRIRDVVPEADFDNAWDAAEKTTGPERAEAIRRMSMIARADSTFAATMCTLNYASPCFYPDPVAAVNWAVRGMEGGNEEAAEWLMFFLIRDDDLDPCATGGRLQQRAEPLGDGHYGPDPFLMRHPVFRVLMDVTGTRRDGHTIYEDHANEMFGFENEVFSITPAIANPVTAALISHRTVFLHKPTGLTIEWPRDIGIGGFLDRPATGEEVVRVLLDCIASVVSSIGRRREDGEAAPTRWTGHPAPVLSMEGRIRAALDLPVDQVVPDDNVGAVVSFSISTVKENGGMCLLQLRRTERGFIAGGTEFQWGPAGEHLFYAAALMPRSEEDFYGPQDSGLPEWRLIVRGKKRDASYGGCVVPQVMEPLIDALGELPSSVTGLQDLRDRLSRIPRLPVHARPSFPGVAYNVLLHRVPSGRESVGAPFVFDWQEVNMHHDGPGLYSSYRDRDMTSMAIVEMDLDDAAVREVLDLFHDVGGIPEDPSCPWWFDVFSEGGITRVSGEGALDLLRRFRELTAGPMEGMEDRVRERIADADGIYDDPLPEHPVTVFDGLTEHRSDYYGLRHERSLRFRRVPRPGAEGRGPRRPFEVRGGRQDEGARFRRSRSRDQDVPPYILQRLLRPRSGGGRDVGPEGEGDGLGGRRPVAGVLPAAPGDASCGPGPHACRADAPHASAGPRRHEASCLRGALGDRTG